MCRSPRMSATSTSRPASAAFSAPARFPLPFSFPFSFSFSFSFFPPPLPTRPPVAPRPPHPNLITPPLPLPPPQTAAILARLHKRHRAEHLAQLLRYRHRLANPHPPRRRRQMRQILRHLLQLLGSQ